MDLTAINGDIQLNKLGVGTNLTLEVKNGDINGTIIGSYDEFTIVSSIKKGKNNLPENKSGGDKSLAVKANNSNIALEFKK